MRKDTRERRIQQLIGGLISSQPVSVEAVSALWSISKSTAESLLDEAQSRLAARSVVNVDAERGRAIQQLEELYRLAVEKKDLRNAINARAELTRLLALDTSATQTSTVDEDEIQRARMALESLGLAETGLPLDELCRRLVMYILTRQKSGDIE